MMAKLKDGHDVSSSTLLLRNNCANTESHFDTSSEIDERDTWNESRRATTAERNSSFSPRSL